MEKEVKEVKKSKKWVAVVEFRDSKNFNHIHNIGDEVEHTDLREKLGLIELK